ncbi:MAG: adenylyltransferase/cytidyltransferase family protein [Selenomonadaceae bacterium]|nr:adenylyltransferase/cytidyltransferase family protein [Selenomonadaceae bacterium]
MEGDFELAREMPTGLLRWYPLHRGENVLYIGDEYDAMANMLRDVKGLNVTVMQLADLADVKGKFAYIVCVTKLEQVASPIESLQLLKGLLATDGILFLGMNNRLGMRYFCGDRDPYTLQSFDSIENYRLAKSQNLPGRMYSQAEIRRLLKEAGLKGRFYAVLSDLRDPNFLFAEGYTPNEDLINRILPSYVYPEAVFLQEEYLCQDLLDNGLFYPLANAYLVECVSADSAAHNLANVDFVTLTLARGKENALMTAVRADSVTKEAVWPEGHSRLARLQYNTALLKSRGIPVVEGNLQDNIYTMPRIEAVTGQVHLQNLLKHDVKEFLAAMDRFRELIFRSSEVYLGTYNMGGREVSTLLLREAFIDMVPLNSFFIDGDFVFYDQEFLIKDYPFEALVFRMVSTFYAYHDELERLLPSVEVYARYGLLEKRRILYNMENAFLQDLRERDFYRPMRRNLPQVHANRERINWTDADYQRHFVQVFDKLDTRKVILFGAGNFARRFMESYGNRYPVYAVLDNQAQKMGQEWCGLEIQSPEFLLTLSPGEYKVLICIKNYMPITKQLENMGITEYAVFDPRKKYELPKHWSPRHLEGKSAKLKKFHLGYVAGVFDLFHIGHLNILRRAKEECDYLIVGVVSDKQVREGKKVEPFVPFAERLAMVKACRYVDEAHEIPFEHPDTDFAWEKYHFDAQFSGSDYEHDPVWLKKKKFLEERGATMVFFPYTESTSSTKLKQLIDKGLL